MTAIDLGGSYMKYLVGLVEREDQFYDSLLEVLATTIFVSITPNDENRIEDGLALRNEYLERAESHEHIPNWGECSVLEVMIALSRHMENMCWDPDSEDAKAS